MWFPTAETLETRDESEGAEIQMQWQCLYLSAWGFDSCSEMYPLYELGYVTQPSLALSGFIIYKQEQQLSSRRLERTSWHDGDALVKRKHLLGTSHVKHCLKHFKTCISLPPPSQELYEKDRWKSICSPGTQGATEPRSEAPTLPHSVCTLGELCQPLASAPEKVAQGGEQAHSGATGMLFLTQLFHLLLNFPRQISQPSAF